MKKVLYCNFAHLLFMCVLLLMMLVPWQAHSFARAADPIIVLVNGQVLALDVPPLIEGDRTLVPVRAIAESLGAVVSWDEIGRRVGISHGNDNITLIIDNDVAYVNGIPRQLDVPARIVNKRTLVPARFVSESLHAEVDWNEQTRTVIITSFVNIAPFSTDLTKLEELVLQELNQRRALLSYPVLHSADELVKMARSHAADMAESGSFSHNSNRFGDTLARSTARGLAVHFEYMVYGLPDAAAIAAAFMRSENGAHLLAKDNCFLGLGLYKAGAEGNADIYGVLELIEGDGFLCATRPYKTQSSEVSLSGYAIAGAPLIVYLLNDSGEYISRRSYSLNTDKLGHFEVTVSLPQKGLYTAVVGQDVLQVNYE